VRADEVRAVVEARSAAGPFRSLDELVARSGVGRPALERLAWSGACDALAAGEAGGAGSASTRLRRPSPRRIALWRLGAAAPGQRAGEEGTQLALPLALPDAPELAPLAAWEAMIADYSTTGLTVHAHPLELLRDGLAERGGVSAADLTRLPHGSQVRIGGLVVARQRPGTANGVVFLLLEDETGTVNLIVPPPVYERDRLVARTEPLVLATGRLERHASAGGAVNVLVQALTPLGAPGRPSAEVKDFSPLDARELERALAERPAAVAAAAGAAAAGGGDGADDFRAIAPPVMNFAQGRRR
jgi:error-prone DNA polymerase